jgi:hypothetical protein
MQMNDRPAKHMAITDMAAMKERTVKVQSPKLIGTTAAWAKLLGSLVGRGAR